MPLYVVATPLGNREDLSPRAISVLKSSDLILAEDTRKLRALLADSRIKNIKRFDAYEEKRLCRDARFIQELKRDIKIVLVSDAGTPAISDPGSSLVALAHTESIEIIPVPGPSALIVALSLSGFDTSKFSFGGYLPGKRSDRQKTLQNYQDSRNCVVFYETPHRIKDCLVDLTQVWGGKRQILLARELTKTYETLYRGTIDEIHKQLKNEEIKGEMVIVLEGENTNDKNADKLSPKDIFMLKLLLNHLPISTASGLSAQLSGKSKKLFYEQAIQTINDD